MSAISSIAGQGMVQYLQQLSSNNQSSSAASDATAPAAKSHHRHGGGHGGGMQKLQDAVTSCPAIRAEQRFDFRSQPDRRRCHQQGAGKGAFGASASRHGFRHQRNRRIAGGARR